MPPACLGRKNVSRKDYQLLLKDKIISLFPAGRAKLGMFEFIYQSWPGLGQKRY
jgi:hypothetical protein